MNKNVKNVNFKSGVAVIVARPNVGKSTLLNKILGQKIAITTPVKQTTRKNLKGIYTDSDSQIILIDTPGIHKPINELGNYLSEQSKIAIEDADLIIFMVDSTKSQAQATIGLLKITLKKQKRPCFWF